MSEAWLGVFLFVLGIIIILLSIAWESGWFKTADASGVLGGPAVGWTGWTVAMLIFGILLVLIGIGLMARGWSKPTPEEKVVKAVKEVKKEKKAKKAKVPPSIVVKQEAPKVMVPLSDKQELDRRRAGDFVDNKIYEHEIPPRAQIKTHPVPGTMPPPGYTNRVIRHPASYPPPPVNYSSSRAAYDSFPSPPVSYSTSYDSYPSSRSSYSSPDSVSYNIN